jgi:hypothetical protein
MYDAFANSLRVVADGSDCEGTEAERIRFSDVSLELCFAAPSHELGWRCDAGSRPNGRARNARNQVLINDTWEGIARGLDNQMSSSPGEYHRLSSCLGFAPLPFIM